jgi:hypothetical protein
MYYVSPMGCTLYRPTKSALSLGCVGQLMSDSESQLFDGLLKSMGLEGRVSLYPDWRAVYDARQSSDCGLIILLSNALQVQALSERVYRYARIEVCVTYHPELLLRQPERKAQAYEDWLWIREYASISS